MSIAIGGWLLLAVAGGAGQHLTVNQIVSTGLVTRGFDNAEDCERERAKYRESAATFCLPALALINR